MGKTGFFPFLKNIIFLGVSHRDQLLFFDSYSQTNQGRKLTIEIHKYCSAVNNCLFLVSGKTISKGTVFGHLNFLTRVATPFNERSWKFENISVAMGSGKCDFYFFRNIILKVF